MNDGEALGQKSGRVVRVGRGPLFSSIRSKLSTCVDPPSERFMSTFGSRTTAESRVDQPLFCLVEVSPLWCVAAGAGGAEVTSREDSPVALTGEDLTCGHEEVQD